jgi:hypothetical protein
MLLPLAAELAAGTLACFIETVISRTTCNNSKLTSPMCLRVNVSDEPDVLLHSLMSDASDVYAHPLLCPLLVPCSMLFGPGWHPVQALQGRHLLTQRGVCQVPCTSHVHVHANVLPAHATVSYTQHNLQEVDRNGSSRAATSLYKFTFNKYRLSDSHSLLSQGSLWGCSACM